MLNENFLVIDCFERIPCNPCEAVCPQKAILIGSDITNLPVADSSKCTGCGLCVASCPGQVIYLIRKKNKNSYVSFPWEYWPFPEENEEVRVVNTKGKVIGTGRVIKVDIKKAYSKTAVITVEVQDEIAGSVRGIERCISMEGKDSKCEALEKPDNNRIICRCEEVTEKEILAALEEGAEDFRGIKLRTRVGMGTCQAKTCYKPLSEIINKYNDRYAKKIAVFPNTVRVPVYPLEWQKVIGADDDEI